MQSESSLIQAKKEWRREIALRKKKHSNEQLIALSKDIIARLEELPEFVAAHTVLLYHSLPDEVFTHALIRKWACRKQILLPVVCHDQLVLRRYRSDLELQQGRYGIGEPVGDDDSDYRSIDLAVIPGIAFDLQNNRLGRGKGYYDRLLPRLECPKIGLCFPFQVIASVPAGREDVRLNRLLY